MTRRPLENGEIDPSHLVALRVLLEEQHVTRAARRLGMTQSSMSHRLARLRSMLGDPLFVRAGPELVPTPRALALAKPLGDALDALGAAVQAQQPFEPKKSRYELTLALPDLLAPVVEALSRAVATLAPATTLRIVAIPEDLPSFLASSFATLSLAPTHLIDPSAMARNLGTLRFGVAARRDHPALRGRMTREKWLAFGHIVVTTGNNRPNPVEVSLAEMRLERRVALVVPSFLMGLWAASTSDFLMNVPLPIAMPAARRLGLELRPAPVALPRVRFAMAWHPRHHRDPAHAFIRDLIAKSLLPLFRVR